MHSSPAAQMLQCSSNEVLAQCSQEKRVRSCIRRLTGTRYGVESANMVSNVGATASTLGRRLLLPMSSNLTIKHLKLLQCFNRIFQLYIYTIHILGLKRFFC
jgi:hypothetical protein